MLLELKPRMARPPPPPSSHAFSRAMQCQFSPRPLGKKGLTPERFWENSERLVQLAESGDRSGFESAVAALLAGNKKCLRSSSSNTSSQVADSSGRRSEPHDESTGATMSTDAALLLGPSASAVSGSPSGTEGVDEGGGDAWQPGGQELHAVLGSTGAGGTCSRKSRHPINRGARGGRRGEETAGGGGQRGGQRRERDSSTRVCVTSGCNLKRFPVRW